MDEIVLRAQARWPDVPDVYGWLSLDRRGQWLLRNPVSQGFEPIGNAGLREFIARNYSSDARGRWFFQNGPQKVFVRLAYTPFVVRTRDASFVDHCGRVFASNGAMLDHEGSVLVRGGSGVALLDDRDLAGYVDACGASIESLPTIASRAVPRHFGFVREPQP